MVYVDLNPIRAGICKLPELSKYTSIRERLLADKLAYDDPQSLEKKPLDSNASLLPFIGTDAQQNSSLTGIAFEQKDYFKLVDWIGKQVRDNKPGSIPATIGSILDRIRADEDEWVNMVTHFGRRFYRVVGPVDLLRQMTEKFDCHWFKGLFQCKRLYQDKLTGLN